MGTDLVLVGLQLNAGDILVDPSLPITGVESSITYLQLSYQRAFGLFGRSASLQIGIPFAHGSTEGEVGGEFLRRETTGFTDIRSRLAINLWGAPAMDAAGFMELRSDPRPIIGASLTVQAPTGEYDPERLINLGTNRWAFKPELGAVLPLGRGWLIEGDVGVWIFTDNDDFLGETREQDPIGSFAVHLVKRFRPGLWASLDGNFYTGGVTRIGESAADDLQRNSRAGFTVAVPIAGRHLVRGSFSTGVTTRSGGDFELYSLGYGFVW